MSFLAATLMLVVKEEYPAFACFANILNIPSILGLYRMEQAAVNTRYRIFMMFLELVGPKKLCSHLMKVGLKPELFLLEWFLTLFTKVLGLDLAVALWDLFILDGEAVLYQGAFVLLSLSAQELMRSDDLAECCLVLNEVRERIEDEQHLRALLTAVALPDCVARDIRALEHEEFALQNRRHTK
eukprot:GEMP01086028.1.p1 GENE.GEMP01086028.1~~GEMP01086028.1.p1  ORF type:complete len:184 (+),score=48.20 GEMP01086028.1:236-787(+)